MHLTEAVLMKNFFRKNIKNDNNPYEKKSYSQSGEDLIIRFIFDQLKISHPTYIDIGAHHPFYLSNTAIFYEQGCRGINIEPDPQLFTEFLSYRNEDINLNLGIGHVTSVLDFYIMDIPALNTFSKEQVELYKREGEFHIKEVKQIQVETVRSILLKHNKGLFPNFLSLDAEGIDEIVLKSLAYENMPTVVCVETLSFSNTGKGVKNLEIISFLQEQGYMLFADTYINSILVLKEAWNKQ